MGRNGYCAYAVSAQPVFSTVTGLNVAPAGIVTVSDVAVAVDTVPITAPKYTMLFVIVVLKLDPVIITLAATVSTFGLTEEIVGAPPIVTTVVATPHDAA